MQEHFHLAFFCSMGTAFFFGLNPILIKRGLMASGNPIRGTLYMLIAHLVSMAVLFFVLGALAEGHFIFETREIVWLVLAGISNYALAISCYSAA